MTTKIIGKNGLSEQEPVISWSPTSGRVITQQFKGPKAVADEFANELMLQNGLEFDLDGLNLDPQGPGTKLLTVTTVDTDGTLTTVKDEQRFAVWELLANDIYKDLRQHPTFNKLSGTPPESIITPEDLNEVDNAIEEGVTLTGLTGVKSDYYTLRLQGVSEYLETGLVLRKTLTVSRRSQINAIYTGINTVVPLPGDVPSTLLGALPGEEWLYRGPNLSSVSANRFQVSREWWHADAWSAILYGGTSVP